MRFLLIGWLVLVVGCSTAGHAPALHDFGRINSSHPGKVAISVNAPTWLWDNRIRYRLLFTSPTQIRFYGLDRWIASPPELFEQALTFSNKNLKYTLLIRLQDFEQQFDALDQARVVLHFYVEAYSIHDKQKMYTQEFHLEQPTKTPDAAGAISGFSALAQQTGEKIQEWLAKKTSQCQRQREEMCTDTD